MKGTLSKGTRWDYTGVAFRKKRKVSSGDLGGLRPINLPQCSLPNYPQINIQSKLRKISFLSNRSFKIRPIATLLRSVCHINT